MTFVLVAAVALLGAAVVALFRRDRQHLLAIASLIERVEHLETTRTVVWPDNARKLREVMHQDR